jgi:NTE family protein
VDHDQPRRTVREWLAGSSPVRIGLVLSGGGLRGASHVGVLQELVHHDIPIDVIVGSSAGAVIAAYYAAVGLTVEALIDDAATFRGRHLMAHSLNIRSRGRWSRTLTKLSGLIPERLAQLENASFDTLHHNVRALGVVCHDLASGRPCYFATGADRGVRLSAIVRASAAVPVLFPPIRVQAEDQTALLLTDGGVSDCLPIQFAQRAPLDATHLIVSDCRWVAGRRAPRNENVVYIRPRLASTGTLWAPASTLVSAVREGRRAVTDEILRTIEGWTQGFAT